MKTKSTFLIFSFILAFSIMFSQTGVINNGAKMIISTGAYLNIDGGTTADYTNETASSLDGRIDLNGTIKIEGDWVNNATSGNILINVGTDGEVNFDGSSTQTISGTSTNYFAMEKLNVASGATLQVAENKDLTLSGIMTNDGTFVIASSATGSASFIDNGTISGTGTETAQIYLTGLNNGSAPIGLWWYLSPAISDATANFIFAPTTYSQLYYWNEDATSHGWNQIIDSANALTVMKGYAARTDANLSLEFTGSLNTGTQNISLTRTTGQTFEGFNLVGNPYPSAIDWDAASGWTKTNISNNTLWFRSNGTYPSYNGNTGIGTLSATQYIPAMQAFWVRVASGQTTGNLGMTNSVRVHSDTAFWKEDRTFPILRLTVDREGDKDEAVIAFISEATNEFDKYDTEKFFATNADYPQIYMNVPEDLQLTVNALPILVEKLTVPLSFKTEMEGLFTITASDFEEIDHKTAIYLEDLKENQMINLRTNDYSFNGKVTDNNDRFLIHFLPGENTGIENLGTFANTPFNNIYSFESYIYIKSDDPDNINARISIINMLGQELLSKNLEKSTLNKIYFNGHNSNYVVRIISNKYNLTKKLYIK